MNRYAMILLAALTALAADVTTRRIDAAASGIAFVTFLLVAFAGVAISYNPPW